MISDQYNHRVIEAKHDKEIVRTFGKIATRGYETHSVARGGLILPYDAKRAGDYTVLLRPLTTTTTRTTPNPSFPCRTYLTRGPA